ncbi:uncharacterized protein LOC126899463 [Daktulosphaira vitifoliae]|uniref:uncharacterized protein LOC126899463 n=3 Tax=Daktulosphaira vitifoliae TaxID=58002 RepID=UPI0021AAAE99|nr:uncharacterized protein LOC126899463 [Daktulosphaira vitifoliae]
MTREFIYLIGPTNIQILGSKLPSIGDCMRVLFYNMRFAKMTLSESCLLVIEECLIFWRKARIPTKDKSHCVKKLKKEYDAWRALEKSKNHGSEHQKNKEKNYIESLNNLFDIAHQDALNIISIAEDRKFLLSQRLPGRPGCMLGVDMVLDAKEKRKEKKIEKELNKKRKHESEALKLFSVETLSDRSVSSEELNNENLILEEPQPGPSGTNRGTIQLITPRLSAALDKCKISDRDAVHILSACLDSLSIDQNNYILNRTSIKNIRQHFRKESADKVKSDFLNKKVNFVVVHWDGKLLPDLTGQDKVDRLPVIITSPDLEQLLGVPQIPSGTGLEISSAVYDNLAKWSLLDKVQAFVFDTTASNTGRINGACTLLEQKLDRDILYLACRHHVYELLLQTAIAETKLHVSSGPDIALFKRFKSTWNNINTKNISIWNTNKNLENIVSPKRENILLFCQEAILKKHPRNDYKEFLELVIIILGGSPPGGIIIRQPGAYHQARWMAKGIYCLKIFLLQQEFKLSKSEETAICRICAFIIKIYIRPWSMADQSCEAPLNDMHLIRTLYEYKNDDKIIADSCLKKFLNHLWYFNQECIVFSIFDNRVSLETRNKMAKIILNNLSTYPSDQSDFGPKKYFLKIDNVETFLKQEFFTDMLEQSSGYFFIRFNIDTEFLKLDSSNWEGDKYYQEAKKIVKSIRVVNDTAERGVKLMEEFNDKLTKNEAQKQFILQVVQKYRKVFPDHKKKSMTATF